MRRSYPSALLGEGLPGIVMPSGCLRGLHLVVEDIRATREELIGRGVDVAEVVDMGGILYAEFRDPDGNTWELQQIPAQE
jgi:catechol 2,3-dioxygenase-like lactoylglutathione lyase family enzyme